MSKPVAWGRVIDGKAITVSLERTPANDEPLYAADRIEALEADFNSAAAAASEYSEFWERHQGDFDQFGNYVPYSQMDGDLRAAKARIEALEAALRRFISWIVRNPR